MTLRCSHHVWPRPTLLCSSTIVTGFSSLSTIASALNGFSSSVGVDGTSHPSLTWQFTKQYQDYIYGIMDECLARLDYAVDT